MTNTTLICRWCRTGTPVVRATGAKARWIVDDPRSTEKTDLVECPHCLLLYFTSDFTASELTSMYSGYRGEQYFRRRNKYEPWYSRRINNAIGHSDHVLIHRRRHLESFLTSQIVAGKIVSPLRVLDVGGDEGQFIPELDSIVAKGVLEVSSVQLVENVQTIPTWEDASRFEPDMIMMCHVLEHTTDAIDFVRNAYACLTTGGLLYIEVPLDRPRKLPRYLASRAQETFTRLVSRRPKLFIISDLVSLVSRRLMGSPLPGSVIKQSEHVNFFDFESLSTVVTSVGFSEIARTSYKPTSGVPVLDVTAAGVLYRKD